MRRKVPPALIGAVAVTALLALYAVNLGTKAWHLITSGEPAGIGLGLAVGVLPLLVVGLIAREWIFAARVQKLADDLAARGELAVDDLPRSPGGRIDKEAAIAHFDLAKAQVQADEHSAAAWYRLAFSYEAAGDKKRARAALRQAVKLARESVLKQS